MPVKSTEIAWLAGILEGEGSFSCYENGSAVCIKLTMNDRDVVNRAACILNYKGTISRSILSSGNHSFTIQMYGSQAIQWMMTIYPLMGIRRREKFRDIINKWKVHVPQSRSHCPNGHEYTPETIYISPSGIKVCRICRQVVQLRQNRIRQRRRKYLKGLANAS